MALVANRMKRAKKVNDVFFYQLSGLIDLDNYFCKF